MKARWLILLLGLCLLACSPPLFALSDADAAAKAGLQPPPAWVFPTPTPLRVLTVRGLWFQDYAVNRALARLGGACVTESWHSLDAVRYYPESYDLLMRHHLVVIGNVNGDAFGPLRRKMLQDYVAQGGAVLFLGGKYAFGAQYHGNAFEEISPVTFSEAGDLTCAPDGLPITPGPETLGKAVAALSWAAQPRVFWYHTVTPKAGAKVLLTASGKPLLIAGTYGKGRVAVFAGSVMGDPQAGHLPFWEWDGWPTVLAETLRWLTAESGHTNTALTEDTREAMKAQFLGTGVKNTADLAPKIQRYLHLCGDRETADLLLRAVANLEDDAPLDLVDDAGQCLLPFVDASCVESLTLLKNSGQTHKISLALRLLAKVDPAHAQTLLETALKNGDVDRGDEDDPLENGGKQVEDDADRAYALRLGALEGFANLGKPDEADLIAEYVAKYQKTHQKASDFPKTTTPDDELYQQSLLAALHCGNAACAGPAIDAIMQNRYLFITLTVILDQPLEDHDPASVEAYRLEHARVMRILSRVQARHDLLTQQLRNLPPSVLPALARRLAAEGDPRAIPLAFAIFGKGLNSGRKLSDEVADTLKNSKLPAIANLANLGTPGG